MDFLIHTVNISFTEWIQKKGTGELKIDQYLPWMEIKHLKSTKLAVQ